MRRNLTQLRQPRKAYRRKRRNRAGITVNLQHKAVLRHFSATSSAIAAAGDDLLVRQQHFALLPFDSGKCFTRKSLPSTVDFHSNLTGKPTSTTTTIGIATIRPPDATAKAIPLASMAASTRMSTSRTIPSASLTLMDSRGIVEAGIQETLYQIQGINRADGVMVVSTPTLALFQPIRLVLQVLQPNLQRMASRIPAMA